MCLFSAPTVEQPEIEDPQYLHNPYLEETAGNLGFLNLQRGGASGLQVSPESAAIGFGGAGGAVGASAASGVAPSLGFGQARSGFGIQTSHGGYITTDGDPSTGGAGSINSPTWDRGDGWDEAQRWLNR